MAENQVNEEINKHYLYNVERQRAIRENPTDRYKYYICSFYDKGKEKKYSVLTDKKLNKGYCEEYLKEVNGKNCLPEDIDRYLPQKQIKRIDYIRTRPWEFDEIPSNKECKEIIEEYMTRDSAVKYSIDNMLEKAFLMDFFVLPANDNGLMKYSPHKIIYTNPKTGKSSVANRMGRQVTHPSIAKILGFSTADSVVTGAVDELEEPYYCDEIQEEKEKGIHNLLLSLIEKGEATIDRGKQSIQTRFSNSMNWMSNPKYQDNVSTSDFETQQMATSFTEALEKIMTNVYAFASRLGLLIFTDEMDTASRVDTVNPRETQRYKKKFMSLRELCKDKFRNLLESEKVVVWLESGHSQEYKEALDGVSTGLPVLRDLKEGLKENYRHSRGAALRLALCDYIRDLIEGDLDVGKLLDSAGDKHKEIQSVSLDSLENLVESSVSGDLYKHWLRGESKYVKELIFSLLEMDVGGCRVGLCEVDTVTGIPPSRLKCVSSSTLSKYGVSVIRESDSVEDVFLLVPGSFEEKFGDYLDVYEEYVQGEREEGGGGGS